MYIFAVTLLALGAQAVEFPVASDKNCTPGENYIQFTGSIFVKDCRKFDRLFNSKYVGCVPNGKYVAIGESYDSMNEYRLGYRMGCSSDGSSGIRFGPLGCIIDGTFVDFGKSQNHVDQESDRGYRLSCVKDDQGSLSIESKGCLLAPRTEDEVFFDLGQLKKVDALDEYCKCSQTGWMLSCATDVKYLANI